MQHMGNSILKYVNVRSHGPARLLTGLGESLRPRCRMYASISVSSDDVMARVIGLVKKYDKIDGGKVTETADFSKDLSLDSLDRVELVMAIEQEFSMEIPDEKADKLTCCADVVKYILSEADSKVTEESQ